MGLEKSITSGKEKRKQFRGAKVYDSTCRNHGGCSWYAGNRQHKHAKRLVNAKQQLNETIKYSCENIYGQLH